MANSSEKVLESSKIIVDLDKCTKCKACITECPTYIFLFENNELSFQDNSDECVECGHCVAVCPVGAVSTKKLSNADVIEITGEVKAPSYQQILNAIKIRRSTRHFKKNPIPHDVWEKLVESTRYIPTAHNYQQIYMTIVSDPEMLDTLSGEMTKIFQLLIDMYKSPIKRKILEDALSKAEMEGLKDFIPVFEEEIKNVESGKRDWNLGREVILFHGIESNTFSKQECAMAANNFMLTAESLGVGTCSLGFLIVATNKMKSLSRLLGIPRKHSVGYALAVGIPRIKYHYIPARQPAKLNWI